MRLGRLAHKLYKYNKRNKMSGKVLLLAVFILCYIHGSQAQDLDTVITKLAQKVADSQIVRPSTKSDFFNKQVGVYPCNIRVNFNGDEASAPLRDSAVVFDNNAFVTLWVSTILLEAAQFESGPQPSYDQLYRSIEAIQTYHDSNRPQADGILVFWPQKLNTTSDLYYCDPGNLVPISEHMDDVLQFLHKVIRDLGLEKLWEKTLLHITQLVESSLKAYHIPADFDDTFVNLGFGAMLSNYTTSKGLFPVWQKSNTNNTEALKALKKYAYRPFSDDPNANFIDTRTYFYLHEYLYDIQKSNRLPALFATTWAQNLDEDKVQNIDVAMPFNANNVDLTVSTNVVNGLSLMLLMPNGTNTTDWFDSELQIIYENTTDLVAWFIERNFSNRPDLALTYYPSVFNFYWFTARTLNLLQSYTVKHGSLPHPTMTRVMQRLSGALRDFATKDLVNKAVTDKDGLMYFDDFLGDNDKDLFGKPVNHAEDRICSTAVAVNALLYTWTENQMLLPTTPVEVIHTIEKASKWLLENVLSGKYKAFNVVFSGSVKTADDLPFFYPAKDLKYLNGTALKPDAIPGADVMIGIRGVIPREEYDHLLTEEHFGRYTPLEFKGYNDEGGWPFWSSEPFTYASVMLALTQYRALQSQLSLLLLAEHE